jgi:putative PIN family toxin of toxin-antitoxin system
LDTLIFAKKYTSIWMTSPSALINLLRWRGKLVTPSRKVTACRNPNDDKFLEAALAAEADCIVSGDADLLVLTPLENIPILRAAEFLARL